MSRIFQRHITILLSLPKLLGISVGDNIKLMELLIWLIIFSCSHGKLDYWSNIGISGREGREDMDERREPFDIFSWISKLDIVGLFLYIHEKQN